MLTLPEFELVRPTSLSEAAGLLASQPPGGVRLLAGGTDILVNMKHGLLEPKTLIDLTSLPGMAEIRATAAGGLRLGALAKLSDIADSPMVQQRAPALASAVSLVAGPQLRNMGTIGGNVCLDTRCVYYNQTHFWRQSLGYCLKKDGTECFVVKRGKRCVAAQSSDSVPVLIALDATVTLVSSDEERQVPVEGLFNRDGAAHLNIQPDEILSSIDIPAPRSGLQMAYNKLRVRKSIDFPALSLAIALACDAEGRVEHIAVVGTALMATPRRLGGLEKFAVGAVLDEPLIAAIAERAHKQFVPLSNILVDPEWRREMVPVFVRRAFAALQPAS